MMKVQWMMQEAHKQDHDVIRITINPDGTLDVTDFNYPPRFKREGKGIPQENMPDWVIDTLCVLRIVGNRTLVDGVGYKVTDTLYYIVDKDSV